MEEAGWLLFGIVIVVVWGFIARAVGLAAKDKKRSRSLWTLMTIFPLGPIMGPLWLSSLPVVGEKSSVGQLIGRLLLVLFVVGNISSRVIEQSGNEKVAERAKDELGFQTESVTQHYKQMTTGEILICLELTQDIKAFQARAELSDDEAQWLFATQTEADRFNQLVERNTTLECDDRTYDYGDLDEAIDLLAEKKNKSIEIMLGQNQAQLPPALAEARMMLAEAAYQANRVAPLTIEDSIRLEGVAIGEGLRLVADNTLLEYQAVEVSQQDLDSYIRPQFTKNRCSEKTVKTALDIGAVVVQRFRGNSGGNVGFFQITAEDC